MIKTYLKAIAILEYFGLPILMFGIRLWIAQIFFYSGLSKIFSFNTSILLFKDIYKVPYINPELADYFSIFFELTCPILLFFGLASRIATIPLIIMTIVIELTYLQMIDHFYWITLLSIILCYGPGKISLDYFIRTRHPERSKT